MTDTRTTEDLLEAVRNMTAEMVEHSDEGRTKGAVQASEQTIELLEEYLKRDDADLEALMAALMHDDLTPFQVFEGAKAAVNELTEDFEKAIKDGDFTQPHLQQLSNMSTMAGMLAQAYVEKHQKVFKNFLEGLLDPKVFK